MPSYENQGTNTSAVFAGAGSSSASWKIYGETAVLIADLVARNIPDRAGPYVLADIGSYKGELMGEILRRLPRHPFVTVAVDINPEALEENIAQRRIVADVAETLLEDNAIDIAICRYVLQWNPPEKQQRILRELNRITRHAVILQHFGCDDDDREHRARIDHVLSGEHLPQLLRKDYYLSTAREIEGWMRKQGLAFERRPQVAVQDVSDSFIDRYDLVGQEARLLKSLLGRHDYIVLTTWVLAPTPVCNPTS